MDKRIHDLFNENILKAAAELFTTTLSDVKKVGGFENYIFEYKKDNQEYILRLSHSFHRTVKEVESELDFVNYLAINHSNVSIPIRSINSKLVEIIKCEDGSYFIATSYIKAKGTHVRKDLVNDQLLINYGKTIGEFHNLTKNYILSANIEKRYNWDQDILILEAKKYLPEEELFVYNKLQELIITINKLPKTKNNYGLIHTDVHMGNFFTDDGQITVFDFDDCAYQWFVSDIAIALFYYIMFISDENKRLEVADNFMKLFMNGYNQVNTLDKDSFLQINLFLKLRELILYIVVYRSCDVKTDNWAKNYISIYRNRILNDIDFVNLDFSKYIN